MNASSARDNSFSRSNSCSRDNFFSSFFFFGLYDMDGRPCVFGEIPVKLCFLNAAVHNETIESFGRLNL